MELGKYIKAMRPKKYMTKDFVVYRAPMEESMTPQLESPQTFAGGGVVQREGFAEKGFVKIPFDTRLKIAFDEINKRNQLGILSRAEDIAKISGIDKSDINKYIRENRLPSFLKKEDAVIRYLDDALENNKPLINFKNKSISDYVNHELPHGSKGRVGTKEIEKFIQINKPELWKDLYAKKTGAMDFINRNPKIQALGVQTYLDNPSVIRNQQYLENLSLGAKQDELRILNAKLKLGPKDFAISQAQDRLVDDLNKAIRRDPSIVLDNPKLIDLASTKFDSVTGEILPAKRDINKIMDDIETGFFSKEHLTPKVTGKMNVEFPTNKILVPKQTNISFIRSAQKFLNDNPKADTSELEAFLNKYGFNVRSQEGKILGPKIGSTIQGNQLDSFAKNLDFYGIDKSKFDLSVPDYSKIQLSEEKKLMNVRKTNLENIIKEDDLLKDPVRKLADRIKNDANFKDVSLTMYPKCKTVKMASAGSPGDSQIVCLAESLMADSDKIKNARNATERLVPESRFRQILTKAGESKPGKFIKWLELGVELPIEGLLVGWDVAFNGTPLKEAVAGNTLFAKAVMGWPSQEKMFEEKVIQNNPAAKFYLEAKKDQARYNELTDSIKNAENDLLAEADLGKLYKEREELLASAKSKYFDADKKFSYMDALKPGSYFQNEYQKAEAEIQSNRIQSLNKKLGSLEGDTESFFGAQQLQQGIEERSLDIQKELIKQYDPTQAEYGAMVKNYLKEIEDKAYKENKKKKGEDLLFDKRVEMYLDKILKSAYEEKYHNFFGQQYQTGGRVGFSTGGAKALWDKMIKFILKNKNRINEVFSTTADQITENSLKQLAEKEPERLKNVYNKLFTHINTTKGEAPKTNLPKVRARVEKEKERFAEAVKEWDEKEMNQAYKNIEHRMTGEDYKYEAQELADELSQVRYKTDFYDLDQKLQLDLYDEAYNFLMEGKRQKAERYKNIKIIGDEEASAMAKTLKEKDPEGYKNIEKIVDDKNTSEKGMFDDLFDRMYSEYEYSKFKDKGRKPNADGGRVGLSDGDDPYNLKSKLPRPENTIPINPELEVKDPSKRSFLKGMGVAGVGLAAAGMGLLKSKALSKKAIKVAEEITSKVDNMPFDVWAEILYQAKQHGRVLSKPFDASDAYQFKNPNVVGKGGKYELKIDLPDVGKKHVEVEEFVDGSIGITYERADGTPNSIYFQRGERQYRTNPDVQIGPEGEPTGPIGSFHEVSPPTVEHGYGYWTRDQKFEMDISSINDGLKDDPIGAHIMKYFDDKFKSRSKDPKSVNKIKEKSNFKSHNELEPDIPDEGYIP